MQLKCYLLSLLRIHRPDCQRCAREKAGDEMRKRLEDLNWRTQFHSPSHGDRCEVIDPPVSGKAQQQKTA